MNERATVWLAPRRWVEEVSTYSMIHHNRVLGGRGASDVTGGGARVICESERKERRRSQRRRMRIRKRGGFGVFFFYMGRWGTCCL